MPAAEPPEPSTPFYLIVADHTRGVFAVEGPTTDDRPWQAAARDARNNHHHVVCGPTGPDRDALAAEYRRVHNLAGVPPGSIVRPSP
jgi:hypothetical protein